MRRLKPRLRVAIIGCGIGGPAAGIFLARAGHDVTVFERSDHLGPKGAGILIAPTGQYVLDRLGLLGPVLARGSRIDRLCGHSSSGREVMDIRYRSLDPKLFGIGIHRGALFSILYDAMMAERIEIQTGQTVELGPSGFGGELTPDTAVQVWDSFDLVVVADGARSSIRASLGLESSARVYPYGAIWASVANWGEYADNILQQGYRGTKRMAGLLPSGRLEGAMSRQISLFWSIPLRQLPLWRINGLDRWKEEVLEVMPGTEELLSQIQSVDQLTVASYVDVRTRRCYRENCVLIGDAAHGTSPQLGQGASLALFDAMILADSLEGEVDVCTAIRSYAEGRRKHLLFYQAASKWMTPFFQSDHGYLGVTRDLLLGPLCRIPQVQRGMVATMCGFKAGVSSRIAEERNVIQMAHGFSA